MCLAFVEKVKKRSFRPVGIPERRLLPWLFIRKALIPAEMPAGLAAKGAGGNRGELAAKVGITKRAMGDFEMFQTGENSPKTLFGLDAKEDEMR